MMTETKKSESCRSEPDASNQTACCPPSRGVEGSSSESPCCGSDINSSPLTDMQAEKRCLNIDFLYLDLDVCDRCQSTESALTEAIDEVAQILEATGVTVTLNKVHITSEAQAVALGFLVSPTILVNGRDIQMNFRESRCDTCGTLCDCEGGVTCREWEFQGEWYSAPPKGLIIDALLKAVYGGAGEAPEEPRPGTATSDNLRRFFSGRP